MQCGVLGSLGARVSYLRACAQNLELLFEMNDAFTSAFVALRLRHAGAFEPLQIALKTRQTVFEL